MTLGWLFSFQGRVRRQHYWASVLVGALAVYLPVLVLGMLGDVDGGALGAVVLVCSLLWILWALAVCVSVLSFQVRRWHDRDKSGWWALIQLIPVLGPVWILVECGCLEGTKGANRFGPSPKQDLRQVFA